MNNETFLELISISQAAITLLTLLIDCLPELTNGKRQTHALFIKKASNHEAKRQTAKNQRALDK